MNTLDWLILGGTLAYIIGYGVWKTHGIRTTEDYLLGKRDLKWYTIGLSIIATQASAITFLSTPGQAFEEGMGFAQFYFGMPIAMVILAAFFIPVFYRLKVYTAYEFLETRFGVATRMLTAGLFLLSRGLAAAITVYAPAIILSSIMGWSLNVTIVIMGGLVIFYTLVGGTDAVSQTQKQQMIIILVGMIIAFFILLNLLPQNISFNDAVRVAGKTGKLEVVNFEFDWNNKYNIWTGIFGSTFLFLSYFGTDQSQVQRYLSGKSLKESRLGLLFNGLFKVPMQFCILFLGAMIFVFYQFEKPPVFFNQAAVTQIQNTEYATQFSELETAHVAIFDIKKQQLINLVDVMNTGNETQIDQAQTRLLDMEAEGKRIKTEVRALIDKSGINIKSKDSDYVFISFVMKYLPHGLIGLLLAVIFSAAMSTTASELNALATATTIDFYKRSIVQNRNDAHYLLASKLFTLGWGILILTFAASVSLFDNLIEAVNIVGSLFYGTILGIFLVAFFFKWIGEKAVFIAALIALASVIAIFSTGTIAYLWLNMIGCVLVITIAILIQIFTQNKPVADELNL